uniref:F-box domain-containing protein n=1 Tax=Psilocybe cubensis TaxID=181762 RepID=A0A8H7YAT6_PSICU
MSSTEPKFQRRKVISSFKFLALPHDIQYLLMDEYLESDDILSMARTCKGLRLRCVDMYLLHHKVVTHTSQSRVRIKILDSVPLLAIYILLSAIPENHFSPATHASIDMDVVSLLDFSDLICHFLESRISVFSLSLYFNYHDLPAFSTSERLPSVFITLLASLGTSCMSLNVEAQKNGSRSKSSQYAARSNRCARRGLLSPSGKSGKRALSKLTSFHRQHRLIESKAKDSMNQFLSLDLDLSLFQPYAMQKLVPFLLKGSTSIVKLNLTSPTNLMICDALQDLHLPFMETLTVSVNDVHSIILPPHFSSRHPRVRHISLLNEVDILTTNPVPYSERPVLELPPLTTAVFSANYSNWSMTDVSSLASIEVHPLNTIIPSSSGAICTAMRSLIAPINRYKGTPAPPYSHVLDFPAFLSEHTTMLSQKTCTCFAGVSEDLAVNIQDLRIYVYAVTSDLHVRLCFLYLTIYSAMYYSYTFENGFAGFRT